MPDRPAVPVIEAPVKVIAPTPESPVYASEKALAPTTTAEQQLMTAGQRRVNERWESTQQWIAIILSLAVAVIAIMLVISRDMAQIAIAIGLISTSWTLVVNSYFTRTNHTKIGGVHSGDAGR